MASDDRTGQLVQGRYRLLRRVGEGSQGKVYLAEDLARAGEVVALKLVEELVGGRRDTSADHVLRWFRHPNWATVLDVGAWGDTGWFEVTRFVHGTSLASLEGPQSEELVAAFLEQGARVLGALHRRGLIHYDVTPGNWMLEWRDGEPHFVLTDGGLAHVGAIRGFGRGTPRYMAPEMTQEGEHDHRVDLYSLGLVAFRLACGREPIEGRAGEVLGRRRKERAPRLREIHPEAPAWAEELIASLLDREPNHRPHDGLALIRALGAARDNELPMFTSPEAAEVTRGGAMIANEAGCAVIDRLVATLDCAPGQEMEGPPENRVPVVIVRGPTDTGATRLSSHALDAARRAELPVVCLQGDAYRDAAIRPFRDMALGLRSHLHGQGSSADGAPESVDAAVEQIVSLIEAAPEPKSVLILVQSFEDFTEDAKTGLQALTRYLQARWMSQSSTTARIGLVLDVGEADSDDFTLPDRRTKTLETITPDLFDAEDVRAFVADRVPGLDLDDTDSAHLASFTEGLPGRLSNLLSQGCARGDVKHEADAWAWDLTHLADYRERHEASPAEMRLISQLGPDELRCAGLLALFPSGLPIDTPGLYPAGQLEPTGAFHHLTRQHEHAGRTYVRLRNDRVLAEVTSRLTTSQRSNLRTAATSLACDERSGLSATQRVSLLVRLNDTRRAVQVAAEVIDSLEAPDRYELRWEVSRLIAGAPESLEEGGVAAAAVGLLSSDRPSAELARTIAKHAGHLPMSPTRSARLCEVLVRTGQPELAAAIVSGRHQTSEDSGGTIDLHLVRGSLAVARRDSRELRAACRAGRAAARSLGTIPADRLAELRSLHAQALMMHGHAPWASKLLERALADAPSNAADLRARLMNNLGAALQESGESTRAIETLSKALDLRVASSNVKGILATSYNLARVLFIGGEGTACSALLQRASSTALRHGNAEMVSAMLSMLGEVYDQQLSCALADQTFERAMAAAEASRSAYRTAFTAHLLAPLCAARGRYQRACELLRLIGSLGREGPGLSEHRRQRPATLRQVVLHLGRARLASASTALLSPESEGTRGALASPMAALLAELRESGGGRMLYCSRPQVGASRDRAAYRLYLVARRARLRGASPERMARILGMMLPGPEMHRGASGPLRRAAFELVLKFAADARSRDIAKWHSALDMVARYSRHSGEQLIHLRATALRSTLTNCVKSDRIRNFSDAVGGLAELLGRQDSRAQGWRLPREYAVARASLAGGSDATLIHYSIAALQAYAHRLISSVGTSNSSDGRLTNALRHVLQATSDLDATGDLNELTRKVSQLTVEMTGCERALVVRKLPDGTQVVSTAMSDAARARGLDPTVSQTVVRRAMELRRPLILHDVFGDEELMQRPSITRLALRSIICAPMLRHEKFYGVVYADVSSAAASFDQVDLEILSLFAEQVAGRLESRLLMFELKQSMEELRSAQDRLIRGERLRTLGELSSGVAHEFNNLLTGILSRMQLLRMERQLDSHVQRELLLVERAALDAAEIVQRLQTFTRRQRERGFVRVNVTSIVDEAVEFLRPLWTGAGPARRVNVRVLTQDGLESLGSATELREVVTNLLKNALDACGDEGRIEIRTHLEWPHVSIEVEDNGPGIPPEVLPRVFDPFYTTKGDRGSGLGLPLSAQIMERHSGSLSVLRTSPSGTVMRVVLPHYSAVSHTPTERPDYAVTEAKRALRIIVVDDDENVREPLRRYLEQVGHDVSAASSAPQVVEQLASGDPPDLLITDISMVGMSGIELCRQALSLHPGLDVVLMTGRASYLEDAGVRNVGARALLAKPFPLQTIDGVIEDCIRRRGT
ncbi:MAG: ATP-binding protein [Planctomycetota bacterium]